MKVQSSAPDLHSAPTHNPRHVAIIMDGNNRWAKQRGLRGVEGHKEGAKAVKNAVENCAKAGVEVLTVYAFSSENWRRPQEEVDALMRLFLQSLAEEVAELHANGIRLVFIGDLSAFEGELLEKMKESMALTEHNDAMTFAVAVNYGGQWDIANACRQLAGQVANGALNVSDIDPELLNRYIALGDFPPPDLCIRTGGERRISNFLLWQLAYAELYFTDMYWPDFDAAALECAFSDFHSRQRRFGRTSEQVIASQQ